MNQYIGYIQIFISALLIASILLQRRGAGSSALMGGSSASYYTKRGFEKVLYAATIILAILFLAVSIVGIVLDR